MDPQLNVHTNCYKGLVQPLFIKEYAAIVWDLHQQSLSNSLEKVQWRAARLITQDVIPATGASGLFSKLGLQPRSNHRTVANFVMMYRIISGLVNLQPLQGMLRPNTRP